MLCRMSEPDPLVDATKRALETFRVALGDDLWAPDVALIAHARALVMVGRMDLGIAALAGGSATCVGAAMHILAAHERLDDAIDVGLTAAARLPEDAPAIRQSVASMLWYQGHHDRARAEIQKNIDDQPDVAAWRDLMAKLVDEGAS